MRVFLCHGFNTTGPWLEPVSDALSDFGYQVIPFRYLTNRMGILRDLLSNRRATRDAALDLAMLARPGDVVVGHSNGAQLIHMALDEYGAQFMRAIYLSPALDRNLAPDSPCLIDVFHTRHDWTVKLARWIPGSLWGDMGAVGYKGNRPGVRNFDMTDHVRTHSGWFDSVKWLAMRIHCRIASVITADQARRAGL